MAASFMENHPIAWIFGWTLFAFAAGGVALLYDGRRAR